MSRSRNGFIANKTKATVPPQHRSPGSPPIREIPAPQNIKHVPRVGGDKSILNEYIGSQSELNKYSGK